MQNLEETQINLSQIINVQQLSNKEAAEQFVWPKYKNDNERIKALSLKYSNMSPAQAFAEEYGIAISMDDSKIYQKDLKTGEIVTITGINGAYGNEVFFEVNNSSVIEVDVRKEKSFLDILGETPASFVEHCGEKTYKEEFIKQKFTALVTESSPSIKASLSAGFADKAKADFFKQIKKPTTAYKAKVIGKNYGGFIVNVMGVQAFLPGSLAAANKIVDFDAYMGKEINVMIEDYLSDLKVFVVSNKKYLEFALPEIIKQYDWTKQHTGTVTGCSKNGVFVEFYESITGLLHPLKMDEETKKRFEAGKYQPGDEITCYVHNIQNNRLVLTNFEPGSPEDMIKVGTIQKGKVTGVGKVGAFVQLKTGDVGVIRPGEKKYQKGDILYAEVVEVAEDGKIFFKEATQNKPNNEVNA